MDGYRISQLAEKVGVPATTLRYYETRGLLPARRTPAGYRAYDDADAERVRFIVTAKDLGLSLDRIRDLLRVWRHGICRDVRDQLVPLLLARITDVEHRIAEFDAFRDHLTAAAARLEALPARDTPCDPACAFLTGEPPAGPALPLRRPGPEDGGPPVACTLTAAEYDDRAARWRAVLAGTVPEPLPDDGLRVRLPVERAEDIASLVAAEVRCCPFLTFRLTVTADRLVVDAHAPSAAAPLLHDLFAAERPTDAC